MLYELFVTVSEALFWVTSGELLINTLWLFPWIVFWALIMSMPMFYATLIKQGRVSSKWPGVVFLIMFFPSLMMAIGPGITQTGMIEECRWVSAEVTIEGVTESQDVRQCRFKENFYDTEYGPWKQMKG